MCLEVRQNFVEIDSFHQMDLRNKSKSDHQAWQHLGTLAPFPAEPHTPLFTKKRKKIFILLQSVSDFQGSKILTFFLFFFFLNSSASILTAFFSKDRLLKVFIQPYCKSKFLNIYFFLFLKIESHSVAQAGLKFVVILLPLTPSVGIIGMGKRTLPTF